MKWWWRLLCTVGFHCWGVWQDDAELTQMRICHWCEREQWRWIKGRP